MSVKYYIEMALKNAKMMRGFEQTEKGFKAVYKSAKEMAERASAAYQQMAHDVQRHLRNIQARSAKSIAAIRQFGSNARTAFGVAAKVAAVATVAFLAASAALTGIVKAAAIEERQQVQLKQFLGSAELAARKMVEARKIATGTPFEIPQVVDTTRQLLAFGGQALATRDNILLVGDAAAATGQPLDNLAFWFGRAYSAIQSGTPLGEVQMRLAEFGLIVPGVAAKMDRLRKAGADSSEIWEVFLTQFERTKGAMEDQSKTLLGIVSNIKDSWGQLVSAIGRSGPMQAAKIAAQALADQLARVSSNGQLTSQVGQQITFAMIAVVDASLHSANAIMKVVESFQNLWRIIKNIQAIKIEKWINTPFGPLPLDITIDTKAPELEVTDDQVIFRNVTLKEVFDQEQEAEDLRKILRTAQGEAQRIVDQWTDENVVEVGNRFEISASALEALGFDKLAATAKDGVVSLSKLDSRIEKIRTQIVNGIDMDALRAEVDAFNKSAEKEAVSKMLERIKEDAKDGVVTLKAFGNVIAESTRKATGPLAGLITSWEDLKARMIEAARLAGVQVPAGFLDMALAAQFAGKQFGNLAWAIQFSQQASVKFADFQQRYNQLFGEAQKVIEATKDAQEIYNEKLEWTNRFLALGLITLEQQTIYLKKYRDAALEAAKAAAMIPNRGLKMAGLAEDRGAGPAESMRAGFAGAQQQLAGQMALNTLNPFGGEALRGMTQYVETVRQLKDEYAEAAIQQTSYFQAANAGIQSMSGNLLGLIKGTITFKEFITQAFEAAIQGLINWATEWFIQNVIMDNAKEAFTNKELARSAKQTGANLGEAASGAAKAYAGIPWVGIALAAAAVAAIFALMSSTKKQSRQYTAYATGGRADGPTHALVGEVEPEYMIPKRNAIQVVDELIGARAARLPSIQRMQMASIGGAGLRAQGPTSAGRPEVHIHATFQNQFQTPDMRRREMDHFKGVLRDVLREESV